MTATVTETGPTEYTTVIESEYITIDETATVLTETILFTKTETTTAATETNQVTTVQTVMVATTAVATNTAHQTVAVLKVREVETARVPRYASLECPSFNMYSSACSCSGVVPITVTAEAPIATATVTVASKQPSGLTKTDTALLTLTATTSVTHTNIISLTATTSVTQTAIVVVTATTTSTKTDTASVTETKVCAIGSKAGAFKAQAENQGSPVQIYANMRNGDSVTLDWQAPTRSTESSYVNKYIWALDNYGRLYLAYTTPVYYVYLTFSASSATRPTLWPQLGSQIAVDSAISNRPQGYDYVYGCLDPSTKELTLNATGRKNILICGGQVYVSSALGEDLNVGPCTKMSPKIIVA